MSLVAEDSSLKLLHLLNTFAKKIRLQNSFQYCSGSTGQPKQKFTGTREKSSGFFYSCSCFLDELPVHFPLAMYVLKFLKSSESTGNHVYIPGVCIFKRDIRTPQLFISTGENEEIGGPFSYRLQSHRIQMDNTSSQSSYCHRSHPFCQCYLDYFFSFV